MDQCLRIAFWMVVLAGCVGGIPLTHIQHLKGVKCPSNVTFTSVTDVQASCYGAALSIMKADLKAAHPWCEPKNLITNAVKTLARFKEHSAPINSSDCSWENQPRKQLKDFVNDAEVFYQELNSLRSSKAPQ